MLSDRHKVALEMRAAGATFQAIGKELGVSASRASAIHQRALALRTGQDVGLRMRSINVLRRSQYRPRELAGLLADDRQKAFVTLLREPNCDRWHAEEIIAWLDAGNVDAVNVVTRPRTAGEVGATVRSGAPFIEKGSLATATDRLRVVPAGLLHG